MAIPKITRSSFTATGAGAIALHVQGQGDVQYTTLGGDTYDIQVDAGAIANVYACDYDTQNALGTLNQESGDRSAWDMTHYAARHASDISTTNYMNHVQAPVARGDLLAADSVPSWKRLALGAANHLLVSNGTDAAWSTGAITFAGASSVLALPNATLTVSAGGTLNLATFTLTLAASMSFPANALGFLHNDGAGVLAWSNAISPGSLALTNEHIFVGNVSNVAADVAMSGDITISNTGVTTLKNTGPGATGPIGDSTHVAAVTIDAQGRTTALTSVAIAFPAAAPHAILSTEHNDTTPAAVSRGDIITGQGVSPTWTRLGKGTQYQVLNIGANEPLWDAVHLDQAAAVTGVLPAANLPGSFSGFANPTASVGLTAVNGVLTTAMRSDAAPPISQSIAPTWTAIHTFRASAIGVVSTDRVVIDNPTGAAAGAQQWSPRLRFSSQGWSTDGGGASRVVDWIIESQTIQGASNPVATLVFSHQVGGAGYLPLMTLHSGSVSEFGDQVIFDSLLSQCPKLVVYNNFSDTNAGAFTLRKSRAGNTPVQAGDQLGIFLFQGRGTSAYSDSALINTEVVSSVGDDIKSKIKFAVASGVGGALADAIIIDETGALKVLNTVDSGSPAGGALIVSGGTGIAKSLFIGSNESVAGYIDITAIANPAAPAAGVVRLHALTTQGFSRLEQDNEAATNITLGRDSVFIVRNTSGLLIAKGKPVYVTGSTGNVPNVSLAKADSTTTLPVVGMTVDDIANNAFGQCMVVGIISNIDTSAFLTGAQLWVSPTTAGALVSTRPVYPGFVQRVGSVLVSNAGTGSILVDIAPFIGHLESGTAATTWTAAGVINLAGTSNQIVMQSAGVTGTLTWTPTGVNKVIALPDATGTVALTTNLAHDILSATHTDSTAAAVVRGDIITGQGATPKWTRLAISVPAANVLNVLGAANGDTEPAWKTVLDSTNPVTLTVSTAAAPGTSLVFSHRDHAHAVTSSSAPGAAASLLATDSSGNLSLAGQMKATVANSGYMAFGSYNTLPSAMTTTLIPYMGSIGVNGTIRRMHIGAYVLTTNDGTNYWTINFIRIDTNATLFSVNTSAMSANTWTQLSSTGRSDAITTGMIGIYVQVVKTNSPGALSLATPALYIE